MTTSCRAHAIRTAFAACPSPSGGRATCGARQDRAYVRRQPQIRRTSHGRGARRARRRALPSSGSRRATGPRARTEVDHRLDLLSNFIQSRAVAAHPLGLADFQQLAAAPEQSTRRGRTGPVGILTGTLRRARGRSQSMTVRGLGRGSCPCCAGFAVPTACSGLKALWQGARTPSRPADLQAERAPFRTSQTPHASPTPV